MLKLPAYLTGFQSKADGSIGLRFGTQELNAEEFMEVKKRLNAFGWLAFSEGDVAESDIPDDIPTDKRKTPSQRLRAVMFLMWAQEGKKGDFNDFYRQKMEQLIEHYKGKLADNVF